MNYTSRRTFLLNRTAWGILLFAVIYLIWGDYYIWTISGISAAIGLYLKWLADSMEKKRRLKAAMECDENGNVKAKRL